MGHKAIICKANIQLVAIKGKMYKKMRKTSSLSQPIFPTTIHNSYNKLFRYKIFIDDLYVHEINQNFLSVGQHLKSIQDYKCIIKDLTGQEMFKVKIKSNNFSFDPMNEDKLNDLQHKKLGHFHRSRMSYMLKKSTCSWRFFLTRKAS
ncbi:hypothetical protein CR513_21322, partial [Mucuna pruriens]